MAQPFTRSCVYTVLIGQYEKLNEQPFAQSSTIPFICFTDDADLHSDTWQIRLIPSTFFMDPIRSQRDIKIRPHVYLPEFEASLYIDNSVLLEKIPEQLFERFPLETPLWVPRHSYRKTVLDEFLEVARMGFDDQNRIFEQLSHYQLQAPNVLEEPPYWTAILVRDHRATIAQNMSEIWFSHVQRYSRRDQLSINMALHQTGCVANVIDVDNFNSDFHSWPISIDRDRTKGARDMRRSLMPLVGQVRELEEQKKSYITELSQKDGLILQLQEENACIKEKIQRLHDLNNRFLRCNFWSVWPIFFLKFGYRKIIFQSLKRFLKLGFGQIKKLIR